MVTSGPTAGPATAGPLTDGIPENFGDQPVFRRPLLVDQIAISGDEPLLAGGWFHEGRVVRFCSFRRFDRAVDLCYSIGLYASASGGDPIWIGRGDTGILPAGLSEEADRPVVLLLHTHDPRCSADDTGCEIRPILSKIVWLGTPQ